RRRGGEMPEPTVACVEWQEHLAGWLVAQLDPTEEAALDDHLRVCAACRAEADSLLVVAAVSLGADPGGEPWEPTRDEAPPPDLGERIAARVAAERRRPVRRRLAIALVALAAVAALGVALRPGDASLDGERVVFALRPPGAEADAVVAADEGGSLVALTASGLDPDLTYSLWLTPPGGGYEERVAAGTFRPDSDGAVDVRLRSALPAAQTGRVWATTPGGDIALDTDAG
ncbi:MAG: zf-HC2 domain-containing protein, partial [Acidimicrobiales bacterium]